jgi:hypothetical protein
MGTDTLGAGILIYHDGATIKHADSRDSTTKLTTTTPRVEVSERGIRVGCSFVTADVLRRLLRELDEFKRCKTKVIQP